MYRYICDEMGISIYKISFVNVYFSTRHGQFVSENASDAYMKDEANPPVM